MPFFQSAFLLYEPTSSWSKLQAGANCRRSDSVCHSCVTMTMASLQMCAVALSCCVLLLCCVCVCVLCVCVCVCVCAVLVSGWFLFF